MALDHGYGVLRGTLTGHFRDPPNNSAAGITST